MADQIGAGLLHQYSSDGKWGLDESEVAELEGRSVVEFEVVVEIVVLEHCSPDFDSARTYSHWGFLLEDLADGWEFQIAGLFAAELG